MIPQQGYYQGNRTDYSRGCSTYGGSSQGNNRGYGSASRGAPPSRTMSTSNYACNTPRAPPVFSSPSACTVNGSSAGYQQQQRWNGGWGSTRTPTQGNKLRQQVGRSVSASQGSNGCGQRQQRMVYQQQPQTQTPLAPAPYCTPQAIKVNVTAEQLANAKNQPIYQDRGEPSQCDNPGVKYIQLNWQDLIGGMENLHVSMMPSCDPNTQNRQLKVSFGGQKLDPPQAGETTLKVVSMEPAVTTGRMDMRQGNALAGAMRICDTPAHLRMTPAANAQMNRGAATTKYQESGCYGNSCPR